MSFKLPHVLSRYRRDYEVDEATSEAHERELKRYFICVVAFRGQVMGMTGPVDDLWHTFLMFTKEYEDFSDLVAGRFLHHQPEVEGKFNERAARNYRRFLKAYEVVFKEQPNEKFWPRKNLTHASWCADGSMCACAGSDGCGCGCGGCGCGCN